jgi:rhodanese-related sulfurtransferase
MLLWPMVHKGAGGSVSATAEAVRLINREKGVLIDVSEPAEFAAGHAMPARATCRWAALEGPRTCRRNKAAAAAAVPVRRARRACRRPAAQGRLREGHGAGRRQRRLARRQPADREEGLIGNLPGRQQGLARARDNRVLHSNRGAMSAVRMYTTQVCPYCVRAKALLKQRGVEQIDEIRIDLDPASATT